MDGGKSPRLRPEQECDLNQRQSNKLVRLASRWEQGILALGNFPAQKQEWAHPYSPSTTLSQPPKNTEERFS